MGGGEGGEWRRRRVGESGGQLRGAGRGKRLVLFLFSRQTLDMAKGSGHRETPTPVSQPVEAPRAGRPSR